MLGGRQKKLKVDFDQNDRNVTKMHTFVQAHFRLFDFFFIFFEIFYFFLISRSNALSYTHYSKYFQATRINAGVDKLLHNGYGPCSWYRYHLVVNSLRRINVIKWLTGL